MPRRYAHRETRRRDLPLFYPPSRPASRAGCEPGAMSRPCPFVSCRHHLFDVVAAIEASSRREAKGGEDEDEIDPPLGEMRETCALDVADRARDRIVAGGEQPSHKEIADAMGLSRDAAKKLEESAMGSLKGWLGGHLARSPIADELGDREAAPDMLSLATDTGWSALGFD